MEDDEIDEDIGAEYASNDIDEVTTTTDDLPSPAQEIEKTFVDQLLQMKGIDDSQRIKFEGENGEVTEKKWDDLNRNEQLNILNSNTESDEFDLDDDEIGLINRIRESGITPKEYIDKLVRDSINNYVNEQEPDVKQYSIDEYTDDELFLTDFISRMGNNVTDEEALEALEKAKSNPTLYEKQIQALKDEYRRIEDENEQQERIAEEEQLQQQQERFSSSIVDLINDFKEFGGYDLNLEEEDMQELYDFITGTDAAGNNYFAKALADPKTLVQTAWLALNGKDMVRDITNYFQKQVSEVRKLSYKKGLEDANRSNVVYRKKQNSSYLDADIDY